MTGQADTGTVHVVRIDRVAASNGGHLVRAAHENWTAPIDGVEGWEYITGDDAVYAFKDDKPSTSTRSGC